MYIICSHEINAAASKSGYTIRPHYLPATDEQKECCLKVCCGCEYINVYYTFTHTYIGAYVCNIMR